MYHRDHPSALHSAIHRDGQSIDVSAVELGSDEGKLQPGTVHIGSHDWLSLPMLDPGMDVQTLLNGTRPNPGLPSPQI